MLFYSHAAQITYFLIKQFMSERNEWTQRSLTIIIFSFLNLLILPVKMSKAPAMLCKLLQCCKGKACTVTLVLLQSKTSHCLFNFLGVNND